MSWWLQFFLAQTNYALATELGNKSEAVQVATLLTAIGDEGREVYSTFTWDDENAYEIEPGLTKFAEYCQPRKNIPFERYRFNQRKQELSESYELTEVKATEESDVYFEETYQTDEISAVCLDDSRFWIHVLGEC